MTPAASRSNVRKYSNPNPVHQWLLRRFLERVTGDLRTALGSHAGPELLDVGCGEGYVLCHLQEAFPGLIMQGMDGDLEALDQAREKMPGVHFWQGDATLLPFQDRSFDTVTCLEVLEHLSEPERALEEMARVSRGYLLLSVPNQPFFALANFLRGQNLRRLGEDAGHVHHWTAPQFLSLVKGRVKLASVSYPFPWILALARV